MQRNSLLHAGFILQQLLQLKGRKTCCTHCMHAHHHFSNYTGAHLVCCITAMRPVTKTADKHLTHPLWYMQQTTPAKLPSNG